MGLKNIFSKKNVQKDVISDSGKVRRTDIFSLNVIIFSTVISVVLIVLGALVLFS